MESSTPRRLIFSFMCLRNARAEISLPSTVACRSWISSVAVSCIVAASATVHLDLDLVVLHLHVVGPHRHRRRERPRPSRVEVERRPVLRTFDGPEVAVHLALGQV